MIYNKKGMLANIIGTFVVILVGITIVPVIAQQVNNAMNCPLYFYENSTNITTGPPIGSTDSFGGGGGDYHFGGYNGQVAHKSFLADLSPIKTNSSILNPDCKPLSPAAQTAMSLLPMFFAVGIGIVAIGSVWSALRTSGNV